MGHRVFETFEEAYNQYGTGAQYGMDGSTDEMKADVDAYNAAVAAAEAAFLTEFPDSAFEATGNLASIGAYNPSFSPLMNLHGQTMTLIMKKFYMAKPVN